MDVVIGSGPAGISCAEALLDAGCREVVMVDAGIRLESDREQRRASLARLSRSELLAADLADISSAPPKKKNAVKLVYGSDFPYRTLRGSIPLLPPDGSLRGSQALGGLSNVWGSAMLPYRQKDIEDWPIRAKELEEPYRRVLARVPVAGQVDQLAAMYPLLTDDHAPLPRSRQAEILLKHMERHRQRLADAHIQFGASRLAVDSIGRGRKGEGCIACGRCLHGCPRQLINSSQQRLPDLERRGVQYRSGYLVESITEKHGGVTVHARTICGTQEVIEADRVFLGAGPLHTATILLRSQRLYETPVELLDSQYFLFPLIQLRGSGRVTEEDLHTLCQLFIEVDDPAVDANTVHLQVYSYNDFLAELLRDKLGPLSRVFPANFALGRLLFVQGYVHSNVSGRLGLTLTRAGGSEAMKLSHSVNPATGQTVRRVLRKMAKLAASTGALPIPSMLDLTDPGRGFHVGGSFPMSAAPRPGQTDRLGRPVGFRRLHVVDSSVFPSIPATTITLTVMANAYRIGFEAAFQEARGNDGT